MKKVLVTGAAGIIGSVVVKYLLSEGKYEITLLDLKTKEVSNGLRSIVEELILFMVILIMKY